MQIQQHKHMVPLQALKMALHMYNLSHDQISLANQYKKMTQHYFYIFQLGIIHTDRHLARLTLHCKDRL